VVVIPLPEHLKVAAAQVEPRILMKAENTEKILAMMEIAAKDDARLIVFPETALTGYMLTRNEAEHVAESVLGLSTMKIASKAKALNVYVVVGLIEKAKGKLYNTAVLIGPGGIIGKYRKMHLPYCGVDRYLAWGDLGYNVFQTEIGNIGINICYDGQHPEGVRILMLKGADIVAHPTALPTGTDFMYKLVNPTNALENNLYIVAADRVGVERGITFLGNSVILDVNGATIAQASAEKEEIIYASLNPFKARAKHIVLKQKENEVHIIRDRRPEYYSLLTKPIEERAIGCHKPRI